MTGLLADQSGGYILHTLLAKTLYSQFFQRVRTPVVKYTLTLGAALAANWLLWSGHFESPFLLALGALSCLFSLYLSRRMKIVDEEGAPAQLGIRPFVSYAPWLAKEIAISNFQVAKIILAPRMRLMRNMVSVGAHEQSELGRVILANSITLTPGTVSVRVNGDRILVHALSLEDSQADIASEMDRRICRMEKRR